MAPPLVGVAVNVTKSPTQTTMPGLADILTEAGTTAATVMVMLLEVAGEPETQANEDVIITVTTSPFTNVEEVNVEEVAPPTFVPLICHWYVGVVPPLVGVAVKTTGSPAQIVAPVEVILTDAGRIAVTVISMVFDTTVAGVAHNAFETMVTETTSPFTKVVVVKVVDVAPNTSTPFTCH